ncbi:MAG: dUTP diphosphatase [Candidatus Eisenbacteria bacterium]
MLETGDAKRARPEAVRVAVRKLPSLGELPLPAYMSDGASGLDLRAAIDEPLELEPGHFKLVPTGIAVAIPPGYEGQVRPRSGLALKHGVLVLNTPGTIDSDYRGEIGVILANLGPNGFRVERGDRVAQLVLARVARVEWSEEESLESTAREGGGFGHTG